MHASLTEERLAELRLTIGTFDLPDPDAFADAMNALDASTVKATSALKDLGKEDLNVFREFDDTRLESCKAFLKRLEEQVTRASRVLGDMTGDIVGDLLVGLTSRWDRLESQAVDLAKKIQLARQRAGTARIEIPSDIDNAKLLADTRRRLEHFRNGGRRGWGFFAPRVVRETRYVEERCRINGDKPYGQEALDVLASFLELQELLKQFCAVWPRGLDEGPSDLTRASQEVGDLVEQLSELLQLFRSCDRAVLNVLPIEGRDTLSERQERVRWRSLIEAELARRRADASKEALEAWLGLIRGVGTENVHPCMADLAKAIEDRDPTRWRSAWEQREALRRDKDRLQRYEELLNRLGKACPELATFVRSKQSDSNWTDRFRQLQQAWNWASARAWLYKVTAPEHYAQLSEERRRLQAKIEKKLEELAAFKAWQAFFQRLDDPTEQSLTAWTKAVARIGKGTGKYAYRHRRTARQYLMSCITKIPAWVMPLYKLWQTVDPKPGVFDTAIVDEASQAGIEALVILLLAKRVIVVGDDKQNSPEAVGILEDDIARLARNHLKDFRFRSEFRPDTSLYDHAERVFGNMISLREHFRCVPEIIRFSNELCYTDSPLIPLRQPPPKRLPPLRTVFVEQGACEGSGQGILNRAEAEAIVKQILECVNDEAYKGKTMGVIVLQGHAQAELIEKKLVEVLEPKVREERKLRCGVPATFQGDQRDVIFLSLVVAPGYPFRALKELEAQRRFNVAMSRARDQVWLFHSVQEHDLRRDDLRWQLLNFFGSPSHQALEAIYEQLDRLERETKRPLRQPGEQPDPFESWFEVDVTLELLRRKYRVRPQLEVAGYRIDLVVEGLVNRLAVECDGEAWHGPERFEQDMARQRQLERAGWMFVRIRESEFYANRERAVNRIVEACKERGIRPIGEEDWNVNFEPDGIATVSDALSEERSRETKQRTSAQAE